MGVLLKVVRGLNSNTWNNLLRIYSQIDKSTKFSQSRLSKQLFLSKLYLYSYKTIISGKEHLFKINITLSLTYRKVKLQYAI